MATKSANVTARVEPEVKFEAEQIISELGLSVSAVINSLYKQIILRRGIPYSLTIPAAQKSVDEMSKVEFDVMMETGLSQAKSGESLPMEKVFDDLLEGIWRVVNNGELVPSARSNCTTLPKQEYRLAGWLYRSATALCQRCEPLFR